MARKKIKRKQTKKPDEFITISTKVANWFRDNVRFVTVVGVGLVVVATLTGAVLLIRAKREAKARDLYQEALTLYPQGLLMNTSQEGFAGIKAKLEEVQQRYGSTGVALNALVDLGNIYFLQEEYDKAAARYSDFLQRSDVTHPLHEQALESLGQTYEAQESWQAALEVYQRLAKEGTPVYQSQTELYLGRVYEAIGDQGKAMIHYENYLNGNPALLFGERIRSKLERWKHSDNPDQQG